MENSKIALVTFVVVACAITGGNCLNVTNQNTTNQNVTNQNVTNQNVTNQNLTSNIRTQEAHKMTFNTEWRLTKELLRRYINRQSLRPVQVHSDVVNITLNMKMVQIIELKEKIQMFSTSVWIEQNWFDPLLAWDMSEYNITEINIPPSDIWTPDIVLANNVNQEYMGRTIGLNEPVVISHSGKVCWLTPIILDSFCKQFVRYFPFDQQFCPMKFYSWNYDSKSLHLTGNKVNIMSNYTASGTWEIMDISIIEHETMRHSSSRETVTFVVHIRRKVFYFFVYLIAPCVLTAVLAILVFFLPAASGERMVVGCTILLALSVFFLLATNYIPETSEAVPLVGRYYSFVIVEICVALVCTSWVLRYHYRNPAMGKIPKWIRVYLFGYVSKLVRIKVPEEMLAKNVLVEEVSEEDGSVGKNTTQDDGDLIGLSLMAAQVTEERKMSAIQEEWQLAAEILNQLFMNIYMLTAFLTFAVVFINAPGLLGDYPEVDMNQIIRYY